MEADDCSGMFGKCSHNCAAVIIAPTHAAQPFDPTDRSLDDPTNLAPVREGRDVESRESAEGLNLQCVVDPRRRHQVFSNLLENSLAANCDPVRIEMQCCEATICENSAVCVSIRDNEPRLTEEQQQKIFDAFYTTKSSGTGLGLAIVRRIVKAHGGQIALGAASTGGAEFVITLPRLET